MEKISHILRGQTRASGPESRALNTRPGAPGSAKAQPEAEEKSATQEAIVQKTSDSFFMSRPRVAEKVAEQPPPAVVHEEEMLARESAHESVSEMNGPQHEEAQLMQPSGYVPRGSYVNVHA